MTRTAFTICEAVDELHELQAAGVICELGGAWATWKRYRTPGGRPVLDDAWFRFSPDGDVVNVHGFGIAAVASDLVDGVELPAGGYTQWGARAERPAGDWFTFDGRGGRVSRGE